MNVLEQQGFTLIEVLVFILISSLLMATLLIGADAALQSSPTVHKEWVALETARGCMEWFLGQRRINGFASLICPSNPSTSACPIPPGYAISANISCTTWNSDSNYKTITVTVTGPVSTTLTAQIGDY